MKPFSFFLKTTAFIVIVASLLGFIPLIYMNVIFGLGALDILTEHKKSSPHRRVREHEQAVIVSKRLPFQKKMEAQDSLINKLKREYLGEEIDLEELERYTDRVLEGKTAKPGVSKLVLAIEEAGKQQVEKTQRKTNLLKAKAEAEKGMLEPVTLPPPKPGNPVIY